MELGAFSVSLNVKDIAASRTFYEHLGFAMIAGDGETWTIMANDDTVIGLFFGMFESNILTFNPGWVGLGRLADEPTDIRAISRHLQEAGIEVDSSTTGDTAAGPAMFTVTDPDGNQILFDQHV